MDDPKRVELDDSVEYLFGRLFGARTARTFSRTRSIARWRKDLRRAFNAIGAALEFNLRNADNLLRRQLAQFVEIALRELKTQNDKDKLNTRAISSLIHIIFQVLGGLPNHRGHSGAIPRTSWKLDAYRTLIYTHTDAQRAKLLWSALSEDERCRPPLPSNPANAIAWFKEQRPGRYLAVF